ncbi:hypothetical protein AUK14_02545 [Candidatus Berkelbacteria bacterium CG2_30_39_44]|uniref:NIF system FeS cluster assembly NifU N-terminal domain-containing protein n=1 Tax=Candidatus Berkelbacteria bacterium CG03_land_8_20_14_0_80_40_36 TaxID=1974509 RepID=A0A2M7CIV9_9BACT|nr:MAG: hypothetical protein AUK14_02545 [Candidatus Berkelbacteria bacterium CG2_30_39_44]PIR28002.1 MAG: hypothetical protein COV39_01400 [Candidatus Berkelbacteria bacterium CG11_big_fil_rev_8_21_14_0_20_40_23]PIV25576.1 MAG: hypothetical protein COS38_00850 [Candidatus Berkelbacteria bacterium CG03_land_8_20_14_0_80_40_36]PIX30458.1 MAG: hypothetical protein COZ62_02540 [Candidatus Berkelbacteria bacterium CG_4_8_14_3_um_filter_39_27]PIZ28808.1 MAG: hypothetical protein COY44_02205 [Candida
MRLDNENLKNMFDIKHNGVSWIYSDKVKKHFLNPKNFITGKTPRWKFNGYGTSGSAACGDVMRVWILVDAKTQKIKRFGWKTFGCASAIATTSMLSEMILNRGGMNIEKATLVTPQMIIAKLNGLPVKKVHCSVLSDRALKNAIEDFKKNLN